jgi:NitT/TauT family transport system ATP-binding protein
MLMSQEIPAVTVLATAATAATATVEELARQKGLIIESLSFAYHNTVVLNDINLVIKDGEFISLLGPSGSGKTTLLRLLAGMESPASGRIVCGEKVIGQPGIDRGMVFQDYSLFPWMNLSENVILAVAKANPQLVKKQRRTLAGEYLDLVGLQDVRLKYPFELSGGMQQRGAIARALALGSPFLLMDEPFGALDPVNRMKLQNLLIQVWRDSSPPKTVVFVTHDVDEALYLGDRVVILGSSPGRIIAEIPVHGSRPRNRVDFFASVEFRELRDQILDYFRLDAIEQLERADRIKSNGEGI